MPGYGHLGCPLWLHKAYDISMGDNYLETFLKAGSHDTAKLLQPATNDCVSAGR